MGPDRTIVTVQQHILREQARFPGSSGEFSFLLSAITLATKMISQCSWFISPVILLLVVAPGQRIDGLSCGQCRLAARKLESRVAN